MMGGTINIDELKQYAALKAQNAASSNTAVPNNIQYYPWQQQPAVPQQPFIGGLGSPFLPHRPVLSDFDIELMAICIANKHPQMEGHASCFCMMKRLEKGISKD